VKPFQLSDPATAELTHAIRFSNRVEEFATEALALLLLPPIGRVVPDPDPHNVSPMSRGAHASDSGAAGSIGLFGRHARV
jgi:hypothetical protein